MAAINPLPPAIGRYLSGYVAARRRMRLVAAALAACGVVLAWTLLVAGVDRYLSLAPWARAVLLVVEGIAVAAVMARPLAQALRRGVDWVEASRQVERRNPSLGERLITVTSQLLAPAEYRGSLQMLDALVTQLSGEVKEADVRTRAEWRAIFGPAVAVLTLALAGAGLWGFSWLNLPRLIDRQLRPFAGTPPVTTTQLDVTPAGARVKEHDPLVIKASVRRLNDATPPMIHLGGEGAEWQESAMAPGPDQNYIYTIPSVEQDQAFYVTAGDARTSTFSIRVLRPPALAELRIRYAYPAYTGRNTLSVHNTDGLIEAPQKTEAVVSVVATEPLSSATMVIGGQRLAMMPTTDPKVWQARLTVLKDRPWTLEMTSDRGVDGHGPGTMRIRAVPDRPPLVRLVQPASDLRLSPRDIVPLTYQALDDYGVAQLAVKAQVNANPPIEYPVRIRGDGRRIDRTFELDLAKMDLKVGDIVSITIAATDKAAQSGTSDVRHILVSPRSIDVSTHQRLAELSQAAEYAAEWADQLTEAQQAVEKVKHADPNLPAEQSAAIAKTSRLLSTAQETGAMLRQSLMRATVYSASPGMSDAIATMVDAAAVGIDGVDRVDETISSRRGVDDSTAGRMTRTAANARELAAQVKRLADGDQAAAVLADRDNLKTPPTTAPTDKPARERRRQMLARATQDINAALMGLGIAPGASDVDEQLQKRVDAATRIVSAAKPVDLISAARRWAAGIRNREFQPPHFDERLAAASQVEAVRPDAEMAAARDLQYASRAAANLSAPAPEGPDQAKRAKETDDALQQFPGVLAALRAEHEVNRAALHAPSPAEARRIHQNGATVHTAATEARKKLIAWGAGPKVTPGELAAKAREQEELALSAGVATETRDFDTAAELDRRLAISLGRPDLADLSAAPRAIDRLSTSQEKIADQTAAASDDSQAAGIADVQQQVADEIGHTGRGGAGVDSVTDSSGDSGESRQKTTEAISQAQEKLASLPMQLTSALESAGGAADARARLAAAQSDAAKAPLDEREAAERVVGMVQLEVDDAQKNFDAAARVFGPSLADDLVETLRPYAPETTGAVTAVEEQLRGALVEIRQSLAQSAETGEREVVEQSAQHVRDAIAQVQEALRDAQAKVVEKDPLVSARWFARAAAEALAAAPPNRRSAAAHQKQTLEALGKASLDALRRSKNARLSQAPGFSPFYLPPLTGAWGDGERPAGERLLQTLPSLREWGRLRDRMSDSIDAPVHESEPAGYSDALRLYFEVLGREDAKPRDDRPQ